MPVAVVALAAGSFAAGATALAAAGTLAASVAAGATMVGSALTIVGTVTGNQKLTKIGAIVGIAGGIGTALTSSAATGSEAATGAASDAGSGAASAGADAATGAAGAAGDAATAGMETFPVPAPATATPLGDSGILGSAGDAAGSAASAANSGAGASSMPASGMIDAVQPLPQATGAATDPLAQAANSTTSAFNAGNTGAGQAVGNAFDTSSTAAGQAGGLDAFTPDSSAIPTNNSALTTLPNIASGPADPTMLQNLQSWVKANPDLAKIAAGTAYGVASSVVASPKDKAMMAMYAQQVAASKQSVADAQRRALWASGRT